MNDALYEQLVSCRTKPLYYILLGGAFLLAVLIAVLGTMFFGVFSFIAGALIALIAYYFISPQLSVEYEYTILNHDLQIDAIYNKSRRKPKMTLDIQTAEIIAPKDSHRMDSYRPEKTYDFSSGRSSEKTYAIVSEHFRSHPLYHMIYHSGIRIDQDTGVLLLIGSTINQEESQR